MLVYGGLFLPMPLFVGFLILSTLVNVGFPGTSGFLPEFLILISILKVTPLLVPPVLFGMFLTTVSSLMMVLRLIFGHVKVNYIRSVFVYLNKS